MTETRSESSSLSSDFSNGRDRPRRKKTAIPSKSSDWKKDNLSEIGVLYEDSACTLQEFMTRIQTNAKNRSVPLPIICGKLIYFTNEIWSLNVNLSGATRDDVHLACSETDAAVVKFGLNESSLEKQLQDNNEKTIFEIWKANLLYFWANLKRFFSRWSKPGQREASFTHLFMMFSRICLLDPETGKAYSGSKQVKGVHVDSIPDVRFSGLPQDGQLMLIVVTQGNQYDGFQGDFSKETFCSDNIDTKILGQHGIELVVEAHDSFFAPCVVGIICIGTKIIFTYLDISRTQLTTIEENKTTTLKSTISYTRPFDFMDASDRKEILQTLFWFGYVQSGSYKTFIEGGM